MRGPDQKQDAIFSYLSPEERVPTDHPLRQIRTLVDGVLQDMSPQFGKLYSEVGRPSIAPERLLRALLLQIFYSVRSERLLMEQLDYNLLFRWFVGMNMDEQVWVATVFTKNRDRLLKHSIAEGFFQRVLRVAQPYLSDEHFTVDGTLIEAWASQKSFQRKGGESQRLDRGNLSDRGGWTRRARCRIADGVPETTQEQQAHDSGRGQGLRHPRLCGRAARPQDHAARDAE
jgi:transposase